MLASCNIWSRLPPESPCKGLAVGPVSNTAEPAALQRIWVPSTSHWLPASLPADKAGSLLCLQRRQSEPKLPMIGQAA